MARLRRRRPPVITGHPADDVLLRRLTYPHLPHRWRHFLYCPDERSCQTIAEEVRDAGFEVIRADRALDQPGHVVIAEGSAVLDAETVRRTRADLEALAARVPGSRYDGWELA